MTTVTEFKHTPDNLIQIKSYSFSFVGVGLNDLSFSGQFYKPVNAIIEIDSTGGAHDTFKLSLDGGVTWTLTLEPITGYQQLWDYGATIIFASIIGHTMGDKWIAIGNQSMYSLTWFQTQETDYNLPITPPGIILQWYVQTGVQALSLVPIPSYILQTGQTEYYMPTPWADGDTYISKKAIYDAAYPQPAIFNGAGLNDMTCNGIFYLNPDSIIIRIDSTGTPDTFKVSFDGGATWDSTGNNITGSDQTIITGVTIKFVATTGHTLDDQWVIFKTEIN